MAPSDLILFNQRTIMRALIHLCYSAEKQNKAAIARMYAAIAKIDEAIGQDPYQATRAPSQEQSPHPIQQPQSSYDPLAGDELYRQQHARIEAAREARAARQLEQIRQRQGNGLQHMPHGQADDFADEQ